jgi:hypothetical protein
MLAIVLLLLAAAPSTAVLPPYASAYRFEDFAVAPETIAEPARPRLTSKGARLFRTQLRKEAAEGPNFAGHLRLAQWGCGSCCADFGIVDLKTGVVWMPGCRAALR